MSPASVKVAAFTVAAASNVTISQVAYKKLDQNNTTSKFKSNQILIMSRLIVI